jgi:hypothetical protein
MGFFAVEAPDADVGAIAMVEPALVVPPRGNSGVEKGALFAAGALTGFFVANVAGIAAEGETAARGAEIGTTACPVVAALAVVGVTGTGAVTTAAVAGAGAEIGAAVEAGVVPLGEVTGVGVISALAVVTGVVGEVDPDVAAADAD